MKIRWLFLLVLGGVLVFGACRSDDAVDAPERKARVTFLVTPNGLGDNNYNDDAAEGIFAFAGETSTALSMLQPTSIEEAGRMIGQWITDNAGRDSAVLVIGSSVYEDVARDAAAAHRDKLDALRAKGGRVLMFESDARIDGISSVVISRYGVSWLAGAMAQNFNALVLTAMPGNPLLEEAIAGFTAARELYAREYEDWPCKTNVHYLADNADGFAMPDSAFRFIARRADDFFFYDEMIFPLLGGSEAGVLRYLNDDEFTMALMVGMDVDQTGLSSRIPFSVVFRIGNVLKRCLYEWLDGDEWPAARRLGMADGAADIVVNPTFADYLTLTDARYDDPDTFANLYQQYKDEAIEKENAYEPQ